MSKLNQGADAIERIALHYQDLMASHALLKELGGAEQAKAEMQAAATAAKAEADKAKKDLAATKKKLEGIEAQCADMEAQTNARCAEKVEQARIDAAAIVDGANANATEIRANANAEAAQVIAAADARAKAADDSITLVVIEKQNLESAVNQAKVELEDLTRRISEARASARALLES